MNIPAQYMTEIRDTATEVLTSRLTESAPVDLRAEQIALALAQDTIPKIVAQALRDAANDYERAMDDDGMFTSTWNWLCERADTISVGTEDA